MSNPSVPTESRQLDAQKVADRLIRKIVHAAFELAETRWDLEISEENNGVGNRVEMADDIVKCLNGEEIGCLDPDDEEDAAKIQQFLNECASEIHAYAAASSSLLPVPTETISVPIIKLIEIRNLIVREEYNEAYHVLYSLADPEFSQLEPWKKWEKLASLPVGESTRPLSEIELRAIAFAAKAHSCQVDKAGHSYLAHPFRVAMAVRAEGEKYFAVGMLHDVPEDTDATLAEITAEFGPEIGEAVGSLTRRKATCSYESDVIRAMTNPIGRKVKPADVADNERPERIGLLEPATQYRLRKKYAIAHKVFKEVGELGLGESREPLPPK